MAGVEQISGGSRRGGHAARSLVQVAFSGPGFGHLQKLLRSGQVRVDGGRVKSDTRIEPGQMIRVPPLDVDRKGDGPVTARTMRGQGDAEVLAQMLIYEDPKVFVFNKPAGLAVQGGSGVTRHRRRHAGGLAQRQGREAAAGAPARPRYVGRAGRGAHAACGDEARRSLSRARCQEDLLGAGARACRRSARTRSRPGWSRSRRRTATACASPGTAKRAPTMPSPTIASSSRPAQTLSWLEMEPYTGRTHQLRVHAAHIGCPIIGDPKYFEADHQLGLSRRHAEPAASACAPHRHPAPGQRRDRRHRAAAAAYAPELEPARLRRGERGGGSVSAAAGTFDRRDAVDAAAVAPDDRAHLFLGAERRRRQARQCRLQPDLPDAGALGDRRPPGVPWCRYRGIPLFTRDGTLLAGHCWPACCSALEFVSIFVGLEYTTVARSTLMVNTMPFWVLVGAHFLLGERMSLAQARRAGCWPSPASRWCFPTSSACPSPTAIIGDLLSLCGGLLWAATDAGDQDDAAWPRRARRSCCSTSSSVSAVDGAAAAAVCRTGVPRGLGACLSLALAVPGDLHRRVHLCAVVLADAPLSGRRAFELRLPDAGVRRAVRRPAARTNRSASASSWRWR